MKLQDLTEKRDPQLVAKIKQLKGSGLSVDEISKQLELSYNLVYKLLRDVGGIAPKPQNASTLTTDDKRSIVNAVVNNKKSVAAEAKKWNVHSSVIERIMIAAIGEDALEKLRQERGIAARVPHTFTPDDYSRIATEFAKNITLQKIGEPLGLSAASVKDAVMRLPNYEELLSKRNELKTTKRTVTTSQIYKKYPQQKVAKMAAAFAKGSTFDKIAADANVSVATAQRIINGLPMYPDLITANRIARSKN